MSEELNQGQQPASSQQKDASSQPETMPDTTSQQPDLFEGQQPAKAMTESVAVHVMTMTTLAYQNLQKASFALMDVVNLLKTYGLIDAIPEELAEQLNSSALLASATALTLMTDKDGANTIGRTLQGMHQAHLKPLDQRPEQPKPQTLTKDEHMHILWGQVAELVSKLQEAGISELQLTLDVVNHPEWRWHKGMNPTALRKLVNWKKGGADSGMVRNVGKLQVMKSALSAKLGHKPEVKPAKPALTSREALQRCFRNPASLDTRLAEFPARKNWLLLEPKRILELNAKHRSKGGKNYLPALLSELDYEASMLAAELAQSEHYKQGGE